MAKSVLVIGAGIAGLSTASYLQRNGFSTRVFEMHDLPGGLCTAWTRNGYTFDGCIHWLMGSGASSNLHDIWNELGAGGLDYIEWEVYTVVHLSGGDRFTVYTDPERLEAEMLRLGPEDVAVAREIRFNIQKAASIDFPAAMDKLPMGRKLSLLAKLPRLASVMKWSKVPISDLASRFSSPALREAFGALYPGEMGAIPVSALFMMLGFMAKKSCGYPIGGSLGFAKAIESKYLSLGGKVDYGFKVDEIVVEEGKAIGIRGAKGEVRGDYVISAADGYDTAKRLLGGRWPNPQFEEAAQTFPRFPSLVLVGLGLKGDWGSQAHSQSFPLERSLRFEDGALLVQRLGIRFFSFDKSMAPANSTAAMVMIDTKNDGYWRSLREGDVAAYRAEKKRLADAVIAALDERIPGLAAAVEVVDVATPATIVRYTGNWRGSFEGFLPAVGVMGRSISRKVPGLAGFRQVGQWVNPGGGLPPCGMDGRNLAKELCKAEGLRFGAD